MDTIFVGGRHLAFIIPLGEVLAMLVSLRKATCLMLTQLRTFWSACGALIPGGCIFVREDFPFLSHAGFLCS